VAIEAHAQTSLTVEYDQDPAQCCENEVPEDVYAWVDYILETGALWAGTIGTLDIVYRFAVPPADGVMVYDRLVGPRLPDAGPWYMVEFDGSLRGWSRRAQRPSAPEGVMDLWNPPVGFHYAFACRDNRVVLRLKATDVEPGGNISLGVKNVSTRLAGLSDGWEYRDDQGIESVRVPCAVSRSAASGSPDASSSWKLTRWRNTASDPAYPDYVSDTEEVDAPPPEWGCSLPDVFEGIRFDYRFDCCCASAASQGGWNPDCDKPGGSHGRGCAVGPSPGGGNPTAPAADAGAADGEETGAAPDAVAPDAVDADEVRDVVPASRADEAGSAIDAATAVPPADVPGAQGGSDTGTAAASPPVGSTLVSRDASAAPPRTPSKKGCGCATAGAAGSIWSCLAVVGVLLLVRLRRRRPAPAPAPQQRCSQPHRPGSLP
jgi:MYXO-CTERM domain-containing protein